MRNDGFINLDRCFKKISIDSANEEQDFLSYFSSNSNELSWQQILDKPKVVVLGEPGSGKTEEFKNQSASLNKKGEYAFSIDLYELVSHRLNEILDRKNQLKKFRAWLNSNSEAWFFLDAVDESKLKRQNDFQSALENFSRDLKDEARKRTHVLLSSRFYSWQHYTDLQLFEALLTVKLTPYANKSPKYSAPEALDDSDDSIEFNEYENSETDNQNINETTVVKIAPLSLEQVEVFVNERGEDGKSFRKALVAQFLEPLSRRPLDVDNLLRYWADNSGFGPYMEMLNHSVKHGLKEPAATKRRDILNPEKAYQGSETLAAMVIFCRKRDIALSEDSSESLNPRDALPAHWKDTEVVSLLDRALFDEPLFGSIRFHHREAEEFLTAKWLKRLTDKNLPTHILKQQLFDELSDEQLILRPSMASVAAWLACFDTEESKQIRDWLHMAEPELFFRAGDPCQLPLEYRKSLLDAVINNYKDWEYTRIDVDTAALTRLADSGMSDYLSEKCLDKSVSYDLRSKFFYMAEFGRIPGLGKSAINVISDEQESNYIKKIACDYIGAVEDEECKLELSGLLSRINSPSESLAASILSLLFPKYISVNTAFEFTKKLNDIGEFSTGFRYSIIRHCEEKCNDEDVIQYMSVMNKLLLFGPPWYREDGEKYKIGQRFIGLGDTLRELLPLTLKNVSHTKEQIKILAESLWIIFYLSRNGKVHDLKEAQLKTLLFEHQEIKKEYLNYTLQKCNEVSGNYNNCFFFFLSVLSPSILSLKDLDWILNEAEKAEPGKAIFLLRIVEDIWRTQKYQSKIRKRAIRLLNSIEITDEKNIPEFPNCLKRYWYYWSSKYRITIGEHYWWKSQKRKLKSKLQWWQNQWALIKLLQKIKRGEHKGALWFLVNELKEKNSSHLARTGWAELRKQRGKLIQGAARKGMIAYWPKFIAKLKHEKDFNDRSIDGGIIIGLTGIQEAISIGQLDFNLINEDQAKILTRYALNEINGFPEWFAVLTKVKPAPVRDILLLAIDYEWQLNTELEHVHDVLAALSYDKTGVSDLVLEPVIEKLKKSDPLHPQVLSQVIRLLYRNLDKSIDVFQEMAKERINDYAIEKPQYFEWMQILLDFDALSAFDVLNNMLAKITDPKKYLVSLASTLSSGSQFNEPVVSKPSYYKPDFLYQFILILFKYLPTKDDPKHSPGVAHSVTDLDETVRFRDGLLARLAESDGDNVKQTLEKLLEEDELEQFYDWIRHLILKRNRRMADNDPWTENQIQIFEQQHEKTPQNPRELFELTCNRIQEIKYWVEISEDSPRGEFNSTSIEKDIRIWVARKLKERSRNAYSVPQEHEIAIGKKQDIRIEAPDIPGPTIIEVKQKEGWSYNELKKHLKDQLVGDYLKAPNARFGIYLITFTGHNGKGSSGVDPETDKTLTFREIVQNLQEFADEIVKSDSNVENVKVFGIDFVSI